MTDNGSVLEWVREGFAGTVPDDEAAALYAVLQTRLGTKRARALLMTMQGEGVLSQEAARVLLPDDQAVRKVSAKLVMGGWPLADDSETAPASWPEPREEPADTGTLSRIVTWLREGYPGGVPETDYVPLLALLERRLTRSEVKHIARALREAEVSPAGPDDIAAAISDYTHGQAPESDMRRVRDQLAKKGWPVEFPDPDPDLG
ncbi:MAG: DUF3349 domain-containing protein [Tetrasphaera sp.]|jgi:hypothetical protein|nr:DUF3349 domain-containing protein [Tetrasphaera sp.]